MARFLGWTFVLIIGVPAALAALLVIMHYVIYPLQHSYNVKRMDAKNDQVWEEAVARVVAVEAELRTADDIEILSTNVVCFEGYYARPWNLKAGAPVSGIAADSIGFEALQAVLPAGGMLDIDLRGICRKALQMEVDELPLMLGESNAQILAPELSLYCSFHHSGRPSETTLIFTDAQQVGMPYIVALEARPLRVLATRADIGSSEVSPINNAFSRRWGLDFRRSGWKEDQACWGDRVGRCDEAMTRYCGANPR